MPATRNPCGIASARPERRARLLHPFPRAIMNIQRIAVIGAGTMGNGIAQVSALAGLAVTMVDVSTAALERGLSTIHSSLDRLVQKEKLQSADKDQATRRIHVTTSYQELKGADLVIEAA